jgi:hypothetical protein
VKNSDRTTRCTLHQAFPTILHHSAKNKPYKTLTTLLKLEQHQKVLDQLNAA